MAKYSDMVMKNMPGCTSFKLMLAWQILCMQPKTVIVIACENMSLLLNKYPETSACMDFSMQTESVCESAHSSNCFTVP